ncbi:MAG: IS4 family transposase, partial [Gammaproteobacteria bacterium]|nr:IS4 family transposase [Gammaproteobacteria bacterium]
MRNIEVFLRAQHPKLYHIGIPWADPNRIRDWRIYVDLTQ